MFITDENTAFTKKWTSLVAKFGKMKKSNFYSIDSWSTYKIEILHLLFALIPCLPRYKFFAFFSYEVKKLVNILELNDFRREVSGGISLPYVTA